MSWVKKAIGTPSQAKKVLDGARKDVKRPKDQVDEQRQKKQGGGN